MNDDENTNQTGQGGQQDTGTPPQGQPEPDAQEEQEEKKDQDTAMPGGDQGGDQPAPAPDTGNSDDDQVVPGTPA